MREFYEERRALNDLSDANEKLGYLLGLIEDAIGICEDYAPQKALTEIYQHVVKARGEMRLAEQVADEYLANELTELVTPLEN